MNQRIGRRQFIHATGGGFLATSLAAAGLRGSGTSGAATPGKFKKAVKIGMVKIQGSLLDKFNLLKELGFDGVELNSPGEFARQEVLEARESSGLTIHGVVDSVHWKKPLSSPDGAERLAGVNALKTALADCKAYGGSTVLLVPAVVNAQVSYDAAYRRSQQEIRKVLPLAQELGVKIALENVWNNFLLSPLEFARYIDEFASPWIGAYFDVGNIVNYGWPEHWIRILDKRILKLDIKEFSRQKRDQEGLWKGFKVELLEGDCDWPEVLKALREIGYEGWGTAEIRGGDRERLKDIAHRMDRIFQS